MEINILKEQVKESQKELCSLQTKDPKIVIRLALIEIGASSFSSNNQKTFQYLKNNLCINNTYQLLIVFVLKNDIFTLL